nr:diguanylate cyclase [Candidatus Reidiella endopervernicosa]
MIDLNKTKDVVPMLARMQASVAQPVHVRDLVLQASASIGVTFYPQADNIDADQLLRQADQAMYQAKLSGKNRFHIFDAEKDQSARGIMKAWNISVMHWRRGNLSSITSPKLICVAVKLSVPKR